MDPNMMNNNNNNGYSNSQSHSLSPIMNMSSGGLSTGAPGNGNSQPSTPSAPKKEKAKKAVDNSTKKKKTR
jgi:hypothetical protein